MDDLDFIIIGAGVGGVNAAYRLKEQLPNSSYTILEARETIGGTWSFFKYPGLRTDSLTSLYSFAWRPWNFHTGLADGASIVTYMEDAARAEGIDKKIQLRHKVTAASWSSAEQRWTLTVDADGLEKQFRASFLFICSGFWSYTKPLETIIPGIDKFEGTVAHPHFWPEDLDLTDKKIVIIGSGATATTMLPVVAERARHVTMLQRRPNYIVSQPGVDTAGEWIKTHFPLWISQPINFWRHFYTEHSFMYFCVCFPGRSRRLIMDFMRQQLPENIPVDVHFNPQYNPYQQRMNSCKDGDFFKALHRDNCDMITDHIETVTAEGILTKSGAKLDADIIVTATGLHAHAMGGLIPTVDGKPLNPGKSFMWRGTMLSGLPNAGIPLSHPTTTFTVGCDIAAKLFIQVYKHARNMGATSAMPFLDRPVDPKTTRSSADLVTPFWVLAKDRLPRVTGEYPWHARTNTLYEYFMLWFGSLDEGMRYTIPSKSKKKEE